MKEFSQFRHNYQYEPDFTDPQKRKRKLSEKPASPPPGKLFRRTRNYSEADLNPTETDPRCNEDWPLATFWPVYVSNFPIKDLDKSIWQDQVAQYFSSKGLLTRMIFYRGPGHPFYDDHQRVNRLLDMLVYFVSKEDAEAAQLWCHRDDYMGYRLNVYCGRQPDYFNLEFCLRVFISDNDALCEQQLKRVCRKAGVQCTGRTSKNVFIIQFTDGRQKFEGKKLLKKFRPERIKNPVTKQRYIERDVKDLILDQIKLDESFMSMKPRADILQELFEETEV